MAKMSFAKVSEQPAAKPQPAAAPQAAPVQEALVVAEHPKEEAPLPVQTAVSLSKWLEGEYSNRDVSLPRLNVVQNTSADFIAAGFVPGSVVLARTLALAKTGEPLELVVLRCRKQYQEDAPFGENNAQVKVFDSADEVQAAGGSLAWGSENYYKPLLHMQVLVRKPQGLVLTEEQDDLFGFSFGAPGAEAEYAMAMFTAAGTGYTGTGKPFISAMANYPKLRNGFPALARWMWKTGMQKGPSGAYYKAQLSFGGYNDADVAGQMQSLAD